MLKTDWYWIHGDKIESPLLKTKGFLASSLSLYNSYFPVHDEIAGLL
jgi:hypothetical protein